MSRPRVPLPAPFSAREDLPKACDAHDVARAFNVSVNTVYDWRKAGKLRKFALKRPFGAKHWSGRKLQAYLDGDGGMASEATHAS